MRSRIRLRGDLLVLVSVSSLVAAASCSDGDSHRKVPSSYPGEAGMAGEGGARETTGGAPTSEGGAAGESAGGAQLGGAAGEPSEGGAGGQPEPSCVPETCAPGACVNGACIPVTTIAKDVNLSSASLTAGRTCAEAIAYSVLTLSGSSATLSAAPQSGCLVPGDELLLINLQGTSAAYENVGNWELLTLSSVAGASVKFTTSAVNFYGAALNGNTGLGVAKTTQRVALIRVPHFGKLVVNAGATVTANAWDGVLGGVLALRATELDLSGTISAAALGYRAGRWSEGDYTCSSNTQTEAGESIDGTGTASTLRNLGASGGISSGTASFNSDNAVVATPGHAQPGVAGFNGKDRTIGEPGAAYGSANAAKLTLGSGPGGALACTFNTTQPPPYLYTELTAQAGGIALLLVDDLEIAATGSITATPPDAPRDVAFSGGYVYVRGTTLALGTARVTALGSFGTVPLGPLMGQKNQASPGYIVLSAKNVTGTTSPAANWLGH